MTVIESFNQVRDIPYSIPVDSEQEDCCCNGKTRKLKNIFEKCDLKVRYRVCTFKWSDLNIPNEILCLQKDDISTHVYLEVDIDEVWIKVDPTWDIGLKDILPVAEWDGRSDTVLAVSPIKVYSVEESERIMSQCSTEDANEIREHHANDFDIAFNKWLEDNRV